MRFSPASVKSCKIHYSLCSRAACTVHLQTEASNVTSIPSNGFSLLSLHSDPTPCLYVCVSRSLCVLMAAKTLSFHSLSLSGGGKDGWENTNVLYSSDIHMHVYTSTCRIVIIPLPTPFGAPSIYCVA